MFISKQDDFPLFDFSETELSFTYRARAWAGCTQVFCVSDPFVLEHEQQYRLLYELHWEVRSRVPCVKSVPKLFRKYWPGWCMQLIRLQIVCRGWDWKGVYFTNPRVLENPLHLRKHFCCWGWDVSTCQCPGITFLDRLCDVSMTSWCLKSSNLSISGKIFIKSKIYSREDVLEMVLSVRIPEV